MNKLPEPIVPIRSLWKAPSRPYVVGFNKPGNGTNVVEYTKVWLPSQWVIVLKRKPFPEKSPHCWLLLLLVGSRYFWEYESDVKLWKRAE